MAIAIAIVIVIVMVIVAAIVSLLSTTKIGSKTVSLNVVQFPQTKSTRNEKVFRALILPKVFQRGTIYYTDARIMAWRGVVQYSMA